jgi:dGTPase
MLKREELEDRENQLLMPYAMKSSLTVGRDNKEEEHEFRTAFQRDHDRIVHSIAFRRLEYKTQVFLNDMGDHYRTRLTHSLEVAGLARTMARSLGLNEDLVETVALAHDLGHTPFGHAGERVLNQLMKDHGGFEHNSQAIRIVTFLEKRNPNYDGLNLTYETRESMIKHSQFGKSNKDYHPELSPLMESYVVDICDEIAYDNHDLDDGLRSGLLIDDDLKELEIWQIASQNVYDKNGTLDRRMQKNRTISTLIGMMMDDLIRNSSKQIELLKIKTLSDVRACKEVPIRFSDKMAEIKKSLEKYLYQKLYRDYRVNRMMYKAELCIEKLFNYFVTHIDSLPMDYQNISKKEGPYRAASDYVAGMTDRYAWQAYEELFSSYGNLKRL